MDYKFLPCNKIIKIEESYIICEITFQKLLLIDELLKPIYQIDINEDKIEEMKNDYLKNPKYWACKKNIILSYFKYDNTHLIHLLDGQHRIEMAKRLYNEDKIDGTFYFYYYNIKSNDEMRELFISINMDSYKNNVYINISELDKPNYELYKSLLSTKYKLYFSKNISEKSNLYSPSEFIELCIKKNINFNDFEKKLIKMNNLFNTLIGYKSLYLEESERFYKDEQNILDKDIFYTFGFKNNNFIDYLQDSNILISHSKFKTIREKLTPKLRKAVWEKEFGNKLKGKCPISICKNEIILEKNGYHCGHIISCKNNGKDELNNLRPICHYCNLKMSSKNWNEYDKPQNKSLFNLF